MLRTVYNRNYIYITLLLLLTEYESDFKSQKHFMLDIRKFSSFYLSFKLTILKMSFGYPMVLRDLLNFSSVVL